MRASDSGSLLAFLSKNDTEVVRRHFDGIFQLQTMFRRLGYDIFQVPYAIRWILGLEPFFEFSVNNEVLK